MGFKRNRATGGVFKTKLAEFGCEDCQNIFESEEDHPACPECGSYRTAHTIKNARCSNA